MERKPVVVFSAQGEMEEEHVRSFLEAHGIRTIAKGEALRHTHAFVLDGLGAVDILVNPVDESEARRLLEQVERGEFVLSDEPIEE